MLDFCARKALRRALYQHIIKKWVVKMRTYYPINVSCQNDEYCAIYIYSEINIYIVSSSRMVLKYTLSLYDNNLFKKLDDIAHKYGFIETNKQTL